ncbi:MAG: response regulator [Firmicutes bacterium]|jgi:response regulator NasT|nr:response regulator [Bacillota bacterium]
MSGSLRVLIAEDEYLCLMGIRSSLRSLGHRVIAEASNGRHAVDQALEKKPDLIIMDINMDDMDGIEAIRRVNEQMLIPSIIVTGYCEDDLVKRATNAGVFAYLVKPVDADDLKSAIEVAMARFEEFKQLKEELHGLEQALEARKYIERAKGILMDRQNLREAEAMRRLQEMSMKSNKRMVEVAKEIIDADNLLRN